MRCWRSRAATGLFIAMIEAMACGTTCVVDGAYYGFDHKELRPNVYGNIYEGSGSIHDLIDEVLTKDISIDASEWVKKYSLDRIDLNRRLT